MSSEIVHFIETCRRKLNLAKEEFLLKLENILRKRRQKAVEEEKIPDLMSELEKKVQEFEERSKDNIDKLEAAVEVMKESLQSKNEAKSKPSTEDIEHETEASNQIAILKKGEEFREDSNNIVIYGIQNDDHQLPVKLMITVQNLIRNNVASDLSVASATRIENGPEAFGSRPVLATFEDPEDVEEILNSPNFFRVGTINSLCYRNSNNI